MTASTQDHLAKLIDRIAKFPHVVVAFSGGVDSSVVAAAAARGLCQQRGCLQSVKLATAVSPALASWQRQTAAAVAKDLDVPHVWVETDELSSEGYRRNEGSRCFYCKQSLYRHLEQISSQFGDTCTILSGTNADDLGDHRPGLTAGRLANVRTPLADLHLNKSMIRQIARAMQLRSADTPASPGDAG
ncbi:MAG: asparagine synthase-related protein, partial [Planctomycetota bacterium]